MEDTGEMVGNDFDIDIDFDDNEIGGYDLIEEDLEIVDEPQEVNQQLTVINPVTLSKEPEKTENIENTENTEQSGFQPEYNEQTAYNYQQEYSEQPEIEQPQEQQQSQEPQEKKAKLSKADKKAAKDNVKLEKANAKAEKSVKIDKQPEDSETIDSEGEMRSSNKKNYILYIIADRTFNGMLSYFRYYGVKVTKIFDSIQDATNTLLMQVEPCKVVIIDSGTGKFTSVSSRQALIELLSISDESNRTAVFYTDSVIKAEAKQNLISESRDITWHKYKTTADVAAILLQNLKKETYVYDIKDEEKIDRSEELLDFRGAQFNHIESMDIGIQNLRLFEIIENESDNCVGKPGEIPGYKIKV